MKNITKKVYLFLILLIIISSGNNSYAFNRNEIKPMVAITPQLNVYSREYFKIGNTGNESSAVFDISGWYILHKSGDYVYVYDYSLNTKTIMSNFTSFDSTVVGFRLIDAKNNLYECTVRVRYGYKHENVETVRYNIYI